ncbi:MAG TPA: translesion DNA synthesis-associated protein ImuA [Burkholderiales bacterium]|nr:translesion DNA synthesis-associated protein ImuA [Burkholderiales bacterium]
MALPETLLQQHGIWRGGQPGSFSSTIPTGYAELARALPGGGWPAGALTEFLGLQEGIGELQLLLPALAKLTAAGKRVVWLAPPHIPYAPALAAAGMDLTNLAVVRAPGRRDALWAAEQVLRAGPCHALLAWFHHARYEELRRLAVAAEGSQAFVALFRPAEAASEPSPAMLRISLEGENESLKVQILKRRGRSAEAPIHLPVNRPVHALGRPAISSASPRNARAPRRLGLPVHA